MPSLPLICIPVRPALGASSRTAGDAGRDHPEGQALHRAVSPGNAAVELAGAVPVAGPPEDVAARGRPYPRPGITPSDTWGQG
jgi:hypothetical protein